MNLLLTKEMSTLTLPLKAGLFHNAPSSSFEASSFHSSPCKIIVALRYVLPFPTITTAYFGATAFKKKSVVELSLP
ncbi:MAG: hypothetical protein WDA24_03630 [Tissierellales bacterium]